MCVSARACACACVWVRVREREVVLRVVCVRGRVTVVPSVWCIVMWVSVVMGVCIGVRVIWCVNVKEREYFCVVFSSLQTVSVSVSMRARA